MLDCLLPAVVAEVYDVEVVVAGDGPCEHQFIGASLWIFQPGGAAKMVGGWGVAIVVDAELLLFGIMTQEIEVVAIDGGDLCASRGFEAARDAKVKEVFAGLGEFVRVAVVVTKR